MLLYNFYPYLSIVYTEDFMSRWKSTRDIERRMKQAEREAIKGEIV